MSLLFFHILRHRNTTVPRFLPEPQVIRINQILDVILDSFDLIGDILLGKKLLILIIINLIIPNRPNSRLLILLSSQQTGKLFFLI